MLGSTQLGHKYISPLGAVLMKALIHLAVIGSLYSQSMIPLLENDLPEEYVTNLSRGATIEKDLSHFAIHSPESLPYYIKYLWFMLPVQDLDSATLYLSHAKQIERAQNQAISSWQKAIDGRIDSLEKNIILRRIAKREFKQGNKLADHDIDPKLPPVTIEKNEEDYFALKVLLGDPMMKYSEGVNYSARRREAERRHLKNWTSNHQALRAGGGLQILKDQYIREGYWKAFERQPDLLEFDPASIVLKSIQTRYTRKVMNHYRLSLIRLPLYAETPLKFSLKKNVPGRFQLNKTYSFRVSGNGLALQVGRRFYRNNYTLPFSYVELSLVLGSFSIDEDIYFENSILVVGSEGSYYWERITADDNILHISNSKVIDLRLVTPLVSSSSIFSLNIGAGLQYRQVNSSHAYTLHWRLNTLSKTGTIVPPPTIEEEDQWDGESQRLSYSDSELLIFPLISLDVATPLSHFSVSGAWNGYESTMGINFLF